MLKGPKILTSFLVIEKNFIVPKDSGPPHISCHRKDFVWSPWNNSHGILGFSFEKNVVARV